MVTGLGAVTPLGPDIETTWSRLIAGESSGAAVTAFETDGHPVRIGCEAREFDPGQWLDKRSLQRTDRFAQFAVAAARMAEADAGVDVASAPDRVGASIATAQGGVASLGGRGRRESRDGRRAERTTTQPETRAEQAARRAKRKRLATPR